MADKERGLLLRLRTKENGDYPVWQIDITAFSAPTPSSNKIELSLNMTIGHNIMYDSSWDAKEFKKKCAEGSTNAVFVDEPADRDLIDEICNDKKVPYAFLRFKDGLMAGNGGSLNVGELKMKMKGSKFGTNGMVEDPSKLFLECKLGDDDKVNSSGG